MTHPKRPPNPGWLFRAALFAAAASLVAYVPYKYATQLHTLQGLYAFLFPLSTLLAAAGIVFAVKPEKACDCSMTMRSGLAVLSGLWLATGLLCVGTLADAVLAHPLRGSFATFHMLAQHVFLSLSLLALALVPGRMARALGAAPVSVGQPLVGSATA